MNHQLPGGSGMSGCLEERHRRKQCTTLLPILPPLPLLLPSPLKKYNWQPQQLTGLFWNARILVTGHILSESQIHLLLLWRGLHLSPTSQIPNVLYLLRSFSLLCTSLANFNKSTDCSEAYTTYTSNKFTLLHIKSIGQDTIHHFRYPRGCGLLYLQYHGKIVYFSKSFYPMCLLPVIPHGQGLGAYTCTVV